MKVNVLTNLTRNMSKMKLVVKKHAPAILMVTGTVSVIGGTVVACKATLKSQEVLATTNEELALHKEAKTRAEEGTLPEGKSYTPEDYKKDMIGTYARATVSMAKLYLPSVILISTGIVAMFASNNILRKRCASLSAAYATLDSIFKKYRKNVIDKYGEEVDRDMRYGVQRKKIEVETVDPETGKTKKSKKEVAVVNLDGYSEYARFFDDISGYYEKNRDGRPNNDYNMMFLLARQKEANFRLERQGYLFLNDVYDMLGLEKSIAGQSVGWIYDPDRADIDSYVTFNIFEYQRENERFIEGYEDVLLLDFNVDGPILDDIKAKHILATK